MEKPVKVLSDVDKLKWSSVTWPSSLAETFKRSRDMKKIKTKLTIDAFRAPQSMLPPIPAQRITQIDEGSPTRKPGDLLEEPLVPPLPEFIITKFGQQIISELNVPP